MQYIAFDSHKHYTLASVERVEHAGQTQEARIQHARGAIEAFLSQCEAGSPVAVEATGNWYWIVDEIEAAGMVPRLVNAFRAKRMMGSMNKTDKLDARGLNRLQRNQTLPSVWIPPGGLRDARELPRARMVLVGQRTQLKNRIQATLAKYALKIPEVSDVFSRRGLVGLMEAIEKLPAESRFATGQLLSQLEELQKRIEAFERRMKERIELDPAMERLMSLPGVGPILASVIALEVGDVDRFPSPSHLAAYAGTTPRVHASGDKVRYGRLRADVNRYLKWAYAEAANVCARFRLPWSDRHVSRLYTRLMRSKGHAKAVGAVARHLAEATYWVLKREENYRDPATGSSTQA